MGDFQLFPMVFHCSTPIRHVSLAIIFYCAAAADAFSISWYSNETDWREIPAEQLSRTEAKICDLKGVEALLIEMEINNVSMSTVFTNFFRLKVFDQRGVDELKMIQLFGSEFSDLREVSARVIRPDGSISVIEKAEIHEREVYNHKGFAVRVKAFALPQIDVGCIVEYKWKSVQSPPKSSRYVYRTSPASVYPLLYPYPVHVAKIRIRPNPRYSFGLFWSNFGEHSELRTTEDGYRELEVRDIHPVHKVDFPPPALNHSPWFAFDYVKLEKKSKGSPMEYWKWRAERLIEYAEDFFSGKNPAIRKATNSLIEGVTDEQEKLRRIYNFVQQEITNLSSDMSGYTEDEKAKLKFNRTVKDVLKRKMGYSYEIEVLFGSMVKAAGFEVQYARCSDRSEIFFNPTYAHQAMLPKFLIAVRTGSGWQFFDPGNPYLPFGLLDWRYSIAYALVGDKDKAIFVNTPMEELGTTSIERIADLDLNENGSVEGEVTIKMTGSIAHDTRHAYDELGDEGLADELLKMFVNAYPGISVSDARMENLMDLKNPLLLKCRITIPRYADTTQNRIFLGPSFFGRMEEKKFSEETREHDIYFRYPAKTVDTVIITPPEGYLLESPKAPESIGNAGFAEHQIQIGRLSTGDIGCRRILQLSTPVLEPKFYGQVKAFFSRLRISDEHLVTLKREIGE
jgi:hypothetical protein